MSTTAAHSTTAFEECRTSPQQHDGAGAVQFPELDVNFGSTERLASLIGGGTLAVLGLSRWSLGGLGLAAIGAGLVYRGATGHCGTYELLGVSTAEPNDRTLSKPIEFQRSITIDRPVEELYRLWRDFSNLPKFMKNLEKVEVIDGKRSHWVAKGPGDRRVEWDAEVTSERENERVSWRSLEGSEVATSGSVEFRRAPDNRGTEVRVHLKYNPPAGLLGAVVAWLSGKSAGQQVQEDLHRLKALLEEGTTLTSEGQSSGSCSRI
jgi:uncharacterized membrane protein